ncbi:hypothetical protein [Streptomyces olivaceus]|uniref:hypothetical protein n=1 Tax=Streptomyces olivaceus TaxID=47716 RepID=UPI001CC8FCFD|nr:hypothetical protein [Streptomyces olivaceus]
MDTLKAVAQRAADCSLAPTHDGSVDFVQAHKVFNTVTFLSASRRFFQMAQVTRPGGWIVSDVMTETYLDRPPCGRGRRTAARGTNSYPAALPRQACVDLFPTLDCSLRASFLAPMGFASTEVLVFRKRAWRPGPPTRTGQL